eukprot:scaffold384423_cov35-Prasinocladus_malaysianus.AAC.1
MTWTPANLFRRRRGVERAVPRGELIAVMGATGTQGGSVALECLNAGFKVRAITRNPESEKAKELVKKGCEVVRADANDLESMKAAFNGCHGAFLVTNYWELLGGGMNHVDACKKEVEQAMTLADACEAADVKHVVWSTLEDSR